MDDQIAIRERGVESDLINMSGKTGMSSKVLNMKFMKQAEVRDEVKEQEEKETKLKDLSEWQTSLSKKIQAKLKGQRKVITVGYSNINSLKQVNTPVIGRRVFEDKEKDKSNKSSELDLGTLWNKDQSDKSSNKKGSKRTSEGATTQDKKKRKSEANQDITPNE